MFLSWTGILLLWLSSVEARWARDVDSSIIQEIQENPSMSYLIQFHAPWCGHCKHLEPIYEDFAKDAQNIENLHVVRLDATIHTDVANHYDIHGFPTIKYIHQSKVITYEGQRTKDALMKFVQRAHGPPVRAITSREMFEELRLNLPSFIVFLVDANNSTLPDEYSSVIDRYYTQVEFYTTNDRSLFHNDESQIYVVKNQHSFPYEPKEYNDKFEVFVQTENVPIFPRVSHSNIRDLILTKKILVLYAYDDKKHDETSLESLTRLQWKERIQQYVNDNIVKFRKQYQFGWSTDLELLSHIAVWSVEEPLFFLYDSQKHSYGIASIDENIDNILMHSAEIIRYTGDGWSKRLLRPFWEMYRTFISMFIEAPLATMLVIGLPSAMLSIICYCVCCLPNESTVPEDPEEDIDDVKPAADKKDD